ncbi:hypothetical protein AMTRI_Chr01g103330 [Amborella trichopoda]
MMILTYCPSLLNLEAIGAYLSHYLPFHPELSPISRVSSSLISFYRIHGHPLIPRTAFPIIDKHLPHFHLALNPSYIMGHIIESGAFSSSAPLPLVFPPTCFDPSPLHQPSPTTPPPTPYEPLCFMTYNLTQPLYQGLTQRLYQGPPNLSNPLNPQPALYTIPRLSSFYEGSYPCFNAPQEPKDLQQSTTGNEELAKQDSIDDISFQQSKEKVKFSSKLWVLNSRILTTSCSSLWILPWGIMDRGGKKSTEN